MRVLTSLLTVMSLKLEPIIKVQVKSGAGNVGRNEAQELLGCVGQGEYGLLVTIAGFTPQAKDFVKGKSLIRLLDGEALLAPTLEHYEDLLPLKRVYVPLPVSQHTDA